MAVLVEAYRIAVRLKAIEDKYPGGYEAFREIIPSEVYYKDDNLLAVEFMNPDNANKFVITLEKLAFTNKDVAYLSQIKGKLHPSTWIKIKKTCCSKIEKSCAKRLA